MRFAVPLDYRVSGNKGRLSVEAGWLLYNGRKQSDARTGIVRGNLGKDISEEFFEFY
jgi:hypothetical protein